MPIEDILDLHTFQPRDIPDLFDDYFAACIEEQIYSVRVIHGKGKGILKKRVQELLKKIPWYCLSKTHLTTPAGGGRLW